MYRGFVYALGSCLLWGLLPFFLKTLHAIPALELLAQRVLWTLVWVLALLLFQGRWPALLRLLRCPKTLMTLATSALLLATNWLLYLWAVKTDRIVESSLGYFIAPLVVVLFGAFFLQERLSVGQKGAMILALGGIVTLSLGTGHAPWLGIALAMAFAGYALLHKANAVAAVESLAIELLLLGIPAALYLLYLGGRGTATVGHMGLTMAFLVALTGLFTAGPLLLYLAGARHLPLVSLGLLQYLTPTLQLFFSVFFSHEAFPPHHLVGFSLIWAALLGCFLLGYGRQAIARAMRVQLPLRGSFR
jgi:chloramphenicol-sensitive protein RarD